MKKLWILLFFVLFYSCDNENNEFEDLLPDIPVNQTIFLNNPEFIDLQVVGGWAYSQGGISGIIVYHYGINTFVAWERSAPHLSPKPCSTMTVKSGIIMKCACDDSEFSILDGAPMTEGVNFSARRYRVITTGPNTLQITNF
ncbi:hypothetical protein [Lutimonas zeaxanthinifaciens]|uniref:hypothetical protein n=1 Tax=Lutimonas zeaxanthinifaciens TaxID=3060215 RepID=UPI00265D49E8|nr:hypothetical protein [Lutimonas sp. YSD2104]WKK66316.1 hypothetical protein QZH61_01550 [Lutimonas sp. YSD2104]